MYPGFLATALCDGCNTTIALYFGSTMESVPVLTESDEKSRCEDRACTRQGSEQHIVRQCGYEFCDGIIEPPDELKRGPELFCKGQGFQSAGIDDGGIVGQCSRLVDRLNECVL